MQPDQRPATPADPELERDWFWTGVPAGFIVAVIAGVGWLLAGVWVALVLAAIAEAAGAVWSGRDGGQCRAMFMLGSLILLVPGLIVEGVVMHYTFLGA